MTRALPSPDACYRALVARDPRFDGLFFVAVSTTGIYCRPVCPARTPRRDRCSFYETAAQAEREAYRACFRCRPELAPRARTEADAFVSRAVERIERAATEGASLEDVAAALGVSSRHLRREVERAIGVTPVELAQTRRLAVAKQLLHDSALPVTAIAHASGFRSLRRFNAAFLARFGVPPTALRREVASPAGRRQLVRLRLDYRPPLAWEALLGFLRERAIAGVESVGRAYRRVIATPEGPRVLVVRHAEDRPALVADLPVEAAPDVVRWTRALRRLFDLDARPELIDALLATDPKLRPSVRALPGLRVPGALDPFETAARVVLGQLVSVKSASTLAGRLARWGEPLHGDAELAYAFPTAARVAGATVAEVAALGVPSLRAGALREVARVFARWHEPEEAMARLEGIAGIGPWTREVLQMRLGGPDAFPATDLGVRKALGAPRDAAARAERWRPYRAYGTQRLWTPLPAPTRTEGAEA